MISPKKVDKATFVMNAQGNARNQESSAYQEHGRTAKKLTGKYPGEEDGA